ncbi:MAG: hypothetical protein KIT14_07420 [bacterium]|nr:hypothetical protein [bacterium]
MVKSLLSRPMVLIGVGGLVATPVGAMTLDRYLAISTEQKVADIQAYCGKQPDTRGCLEKQAEALLAMGPEDVKRYSPAKIDDCLRRYPDMSGVKDCLLWNR